MLVEEETDRCSKRRKLNLPHHPPLHDLLKPTFPVTNTTPASSASHPSSASNSVPSSTSSTSQKPAAALRIPPDAVISKDLGTYVDRDSKLLASLGWKAFVQQRRPRGDFAEVEALGHPARPLLTHYKKHGVPVRLHTKPWGREEIESAFQRGAHSSCFDYIDFLEEEFVDMINKGSWVVLPYNQVKHLPNLRISPPGVVPQRERRPRWIVDYSFWGLNDETIKELAPLDAMQFGHTLERILRELLLADPELGPMYLLKLDISDGFYRVNLAIEDVPKLGVVFPTKPGSEPLVAFPLVLPMGWTSSPPCFSAVTETAADLANASLLQNVPSKPHPLDALAATMDSAPASTANRTSSSPSDKPTTATTTSTRAVTLKGHPGLEGSQSIFGVPRDPHLPNHTKPVNYVDVFVDDFIAICQGDQQRQHVRRTLLHAVDSVFRTNDYQDSIFRKEPVSIKKLKKGDVSWSTVKSVLGWIINTTDMTITLPEHRVQRLGEILASIPATQKRTTVKKWHKLLGELRSMALALPGARNLFSHMQHALSTQVNERIRLSKEVHGALDDFRWMHKDIATRPTRIQELVPLPASALGFHDASGEGAGGVWFPASSLHSRETSPNPHQPIVWRYEWPQHIKSQLITDANPGGSISISDLELAGGLIHLDILSRSFDIRERTVLSKTDNLATLFWQRKGSTTTNKVPAHLLRLFGIHQRQHRYVPRHDYISGASNPMADDSSQIILSACPPSIQANFRRDLRLAQEDVSRGVSTGRTTSANTHWQAWTKFASDLGFDPLLQTISDKVPLLQVFLRRVRSGELSANRNPIKSRSAEDYLRSIGQAFLALGESDPRLNINNKIDFRLQRMLSAYSKADPPPNRVKPVPIMVIRRIFAVAFANPQDIISQCLADMIGLAFFFLLRPGEYTDTASDTTPFTYADVQLFCGHQRLNLATATDANIMSATFASLTFTTQKNGVRGEVIGLSHSGDPILSPPRILGRRILHLRSHAAPPTTPLARCFPGPQAHAITPSAITTALRQAVLTLGPTLGFLPSDVSARCLRAAGANALLCANVDSDVIRLLGRWRSDEMLRYLHLQAAPIMNDFSRLMLTGGSYTLVPNQLVPSL